MTDFRKQAEVVKLARLLGTVPEALVFLDALDASALQDLRQASSRYLLGKQRAQLGRIATASKLLPVSLVSCIAERAMGPLLCARVASEISAHRAIEISRHLSPAFMASAALHLEPELARDITAALPVTRVVAVARELVAQKEFITLGDLVDMLPMSIIEAVVRDQRDGETLLRIGFFIENPARLNAILDTLPLARLQAIIAAAADEKADLWPYALALMSVVTPQWQERLVTMAAEGDEQTLSSMIRGVVKHDLWSAVLPLLGLMTEANRRRVINLPVLQDDFVLRRLLRAAEENDFWRYLLPLIPLMEDGLRQRTAGLTDELSEDSLRHLAPLLND